MGFIDIFLPLPFVAPARVEQITPILLGITLCNSQQHISLIFNLRRGLISQGKWKHLCSCAGPLNITSDGTDGSNGKDWIWPIAFFFFFLLSGTSVLLRAKSKMREMSINHTVHSCTALRWGKISENFCIGLLLMLPNGTSIYSSIAPPWILGPCKREVKSMRQEPRNPDFVWAKLQKPSVLHFQ